jgi:hypothetical protein
MHISYDCIVCVKLSADHDNGCYCQAFLQFDVDDEGVVDARFMLDCIKKYMKGGSPNNDLESSIRMLQMCPLTPGWIL